MSDEQVLKLFARAPTNSSRTTICARPSRGAWSRPRPTIPHFYLTLDCELDALLALRAQLNAAAPMKKTDKGEVPAYKLSVNDMVIKAMALALHGVPDANASWTESAMVKHKHADVGVAVSIPGGLITPIIRHADEKTLSAISNEMKDLASRATQPQAEARGISGRHHGGLQSRHVRHQGLCRRHQPAACDDPGGRRRRGAGGGQERRDQGRHRHVGDAVDRPPRRRRRARRRTAASPSSATSKTRWACWSRRRSRAVRTFFTSFMAFFLSLLCRRHGCAVDWR